MSYVEKLAAEEPAKKLVTKAKEEARKLMKKNWDKVLKCANALMKKGLLTREELIKIFGRQKSKDKAWGRPPTNKKPELEYGSQNGADGLASISDELEYHEKHTNFELRETKLMCTNGELNAENKALKEKVDKMEQEKQQQEEKKYVSVGVINLLVERMKTLENQQQQKVNAYSAWVMGHQQQVMNDNDVQLLMNRFNNAKSNEEVEDFFLELRKTPHLFNAFLKLYKKMPIVGQLNFFQSMKNDGKCAAMDKTNSVDGPTDEKHLPMTHLPTKFTKKTLSMPKQQNSWNATFCQSKSVVTII